MLCLLKMDRLGRRFFFLFWVGELFITHTSTCNERNHKCQTEGHSQPKLQATLTTWVEAGTSVCKESACQARQAAYKAIVHHLRPSLSIFNKQIESAQHSCQRKKLCLNGTKRTCETPLFKVLGKTSTLSRGCSRQSTRRSMACEAPALSR